MKSFNDLENDKCYYKVISNSVFINFLCKKENGKTILHSSLGQYYHEPHRFWLVAVANEQWPRKISADEFYEGWLNETDNFKHLRNPYKTQK
jgi:hypothetical protein